MSDHEPEPTGYPKHDRTCLLSIHDAPEGSMPCTCGAVESGVGERMSDVTLTEFLLARIAEDEAAAQAVTALMYWSYVLPAPEKDAWTVHLMRNNPGRVLAECESKRRIVEMGTPECGGHHPDPDAFERKFGFRPAEHWPIAYADGCDGCSATSASDRDHERVLRALALPYAEHPDYREEWRP